MTGVRVLMAGKGGVGKRAPTPSGDKDSARARTVDPFLFDLVMEADESEAIPDFDDALTRDAILCRRASAAAKQAHDRVTLNGIAFFRPPGLIFDPFKTEEQVSRVARLKAEEEKAAKELERIRKDRDNRKFSKKMAKEAKVMKQQEATKQKKDMAKAREELRGKKSMLNNLGKDEFEVDLATDLESDTDRPTKKRPSSHKKNVNGRKGKAVSAKRSLKDQKYGFGGKKRGKKANTSESLDAGPDAFNPKRMKKPFPGTSKPARHRQTRSKRT